ncbi:hypothetical protein HDA32_005367 [Spinactinospora alkalitolerans]|uniref:Uncharacterized protein n=1 Tax=Spinactinospora alkalitolerans TaxID=687207 RepID=A0A852U3T5_9ACTN|nr:hypothetical protein [Spinactinospora alkalitolerans]NYE50247.1 hypothetical protein [Spinactinospora alkalitolerans]
MNLDADTLLVHRLGADLLTAVESASSDPGAVAAAAGLALSGADSSDPARAHKRQVALVGYLALVAVEVFARTRQGDAAGFAERITAELTRLAL